MKKIIYVITLSESAAQGYETLLSELFGEVAQIKYKSFETGMLNSVEEADLYLICATSSDVFEYIMSLIPHKEKVVISRLTFRKKAIESLRRLPKGTRALLVNLSYNMAIETLVDLNRNDITHIDFYPMGPENTSYPNLDIAVTPGEKKYVPVCAKNIIDLGARAFSESVIVEIALKLGFGRFLHSEKFKTYIDEICEEDYSILALADENKRFETKLQCLVESMPIGIIGTDDMGRINVCNKSAEVMLGIKRELLKDKLLKETGTYFRHVDTWENDGSGMAYKLIYINNTAVSVTKAPIIQNEEISGHFILLQKFTDEENNQQKLRIQFYDRGGTSKYTFDDIAGQCAQMIKAKTIAKKMALTDASVLLTGESGTGKELFAHSIHHASRRSAMPFVAINCAAIPEALLESELFGYEEGAFTGAKRGGKTGLFEYAHKGTLFLDEIEGMSKNLQVKLLRVLQEKEIMRVGGNAIIPIDVRIIAATNENILELVNRGDFRKDLYYRINILPLNLPPLRERQGDILMLADRICAENGANYILSEKTKEVFRKHRWDGNVRELKNILEYLKFLDKEEIEPDDLPDIMRNNSGLKDEPSEGSLQSDFDAELGRYSRKAAKILGIIAEYPLKNGRRSICMQFEKGGEKISEAEVRTILGLLWENGYINISVGREGNSVTRKGAEINGIKMGL